MNVYGLIHLINTSELHLAMVPSQVFDRAQVQEESANANAPYKVGVGSIGPVRKLISRKENNIIKQLKKRAPLPEIRMFGGIGRLRNKWPLLPMLKQWRRTRFKNMPVIYHCRNESGLSIAKQLKDIFPGDKIVLDIRGARPLERLASQGIFDPAHLDESSKENYNQQMHDLKSSIAIADGVTTVSKPLKNWLIENAGAPKETEVIPNSVKFLSDRSKREELRELWGIQDKIAILFLGSTQRFKPREDLVLPFMKKAQEISEKVIPVIITQHPEKMKELVEENNIDSSRLTLTSLPQEEVAKVLPAMDLGLLLRVPTPLNKTVQPTKVGEYLAAGLPIVVEEGIGDVPAMLADYNAGITIKTAHQTEEEMAKEVRRVLEWLEDSSERVYQNAQKLASANFLWAENSKKEQSMYVRLLKESKNN